MSCAGWKILGFWGQPPVGIWGTALPFSAALLWHHLSEPCAATSLVQENFTCDPSYDPQIRIS